MKLLEIADNRWHYMYILELQNTAASITSMYDGDSETAKKLKSRVKPTLSDEEIRVLMQTVHTDIASNFKWEYIFRTPTGVAFFFSFDKEETRHDVSEKFVTRIGFGLHKLNKQFVGSSWMPDTDENRAKLVRQFGPIENITAQIL